MCIPQISLKSVTTEISS